MAKKYYAVRTGRKTRCICMTWAGCRNRVRIFQEQNLNFSTMEEAQAFAGVVRGHPGYFSRAENLRPDQVIAT